MLSCLDFYNELTHRGINFFAGVPDSLLKDFCAYITDNVDSKNNIITANEGGAISLSSGYHLATGKIPLVYMQNSGQGNAVNPLTSLADPEVYKIPMILLIGWRGEPGVHDEPQHVKQGKITLDLLVTLGIPYSILPQSLEEAKVCLNEMFASLKEKGLPYALVVRKDTFEHYELKNKLITNYELGREDALDLVLSELNENDIIVSTTGMLSRELFEYREKRKEGHEQDFLTVGSMGHASQIALGIALQKPERQVYCFDGDGALIMHMGALAITGSQQVPNFRHVVFNNGSHDSVGGQPTVGFNIDITSIAKSCGYKIAIKAENSEELERGLRFLRENEGPSLLEIRVNKGARKDLGRPSTTPLQNKEAFMKHLR